jgi:hypothetical protein
VLVQACAAVGSLLAANHSVRRYMVAPQSTSCGGCARGGADPTPARPRASSSPGDWVARGSGVHNDEFRLSSF